MLRIKGTVPIASFRGTAPFVLLLLDYDGTLTPIVKTPNQAKLSPKTRSLLKKLASSRRVTLAIVSGRELKSVRRLVRVPGIIYAGNHGLELKGGGIRFVSARARKAKPVLKRLRRQLNASLAPIRGAWVEDKTLTLSIHYRQTPASKWCALKQSVLNVTREARKKKAVKLTEGKCVIEVRPNTTWDKGACVKWLIQKSRRSVPIYIGDDKTDEAAFGAVNRARGISILVAKMQKKTKARYRLRSPGEVQQFLRRLGPFFDE